MDDLPNLPFEKVMSYLDLKDLFNVRAVSKRFNLAIDNLKVRSLCYSRYKSRFVRNKHRLVVGEFARNFIGTRNFESFFTRFGQSILSDLRHLRICDLNGKTAGLIGITNSFKNLESLHLVHVCNFGGVFKLVLPKLKSFRLDDSIVDDHHTSDRFNWTLDAPRLSAFRVVWYHLPNPRLNVVHPESVETLVISQSSFLDLERFKNLKLLRCERLNLVDYTLLSSLQQLREIHFEDDRSVLERFHEQKQRNRRDELKIYYRGLCLDGPNYYPQSLLLGLNQENLRFMIANYSRLAGELAFYYKIRYSDIAAVRRLPLDFWGKLTGLEQIELTELIERAENVKPLLEVLSCCPSVRALAFSWSPSKNLFDQLSAHWSISKIQCFTFTCYNSDFSFLSKFEHLTELVVKMNDVNVITKIFNELKFTGALWFKSDGVAGQVEVGGSRRFLLRIKNRDAGEYSEIEDAVQAIVKHKIQFEKVINSFRQSTKSFQRVPARGRWLPFNIKI